MVPFSRDIFKALFFSCVCVSLSLFFCVFFRLKKNSSKSLQPKERRAQKPDHLIPFVSLSMEIHPFRLKPGQVRVLCSLFSLASFFLSLSSDSVCVLDRSIAHIIIIIIIIESPIARALLQ